MHRLVPLLIAFFTVTPTASAAWVWPVTGEVITPYRNGTDPYANGQHRGIDIGAPAGTPVVAAGAGEVRFAGTAGSSGLTISIRTGDGYDTSYLHLSSVAVRAGAHVSTGDRIGAVGTTGTRSATAPHLHFGVRDAGTRHDYHDPMALLPPPPPARAPDPPAAPVPAPQPAPLSATPVTVPRVAPRPHAAPHARPRAVPHARPRAVPHARPRAVPRARLHLVPRGRPHAAPGTRVHPVSRAAPLNSPRRAPDRRPFPIQAEEHRTAPHPRSTPAGPPQVRSGAGPLPPALSTRGSPRPAPHGAAGGPDIGWLGACIALLLAGGLLGLTGDRGTGTSTRIRALLRPLAARR
jgi:hypothetical protein